MPSIDSNFGGTTAGFGSAGALTFNVTTTTTDEVIMLSIMNGLNAGPYAVSSISDVAGLTWFKRASAQYVTGLGTFNHEVWWAHAPTPLTADQVTIFFAGSAHCAVSQIAVIGAASPDSPFDPNASVPGYVGNDQTSAVCPPISSDQSTIEALIAYCGAGNISGALVSSPFSVLTSSAGSNSNSAGWIGVSRSQQAVNLQCNVSGNGNAPTSLITDVIDGPGVLLFDFICGGF